MECDLNLNRIGYAFLAGIMLILLIFVYHHIKFLMIINKIPGFTTIPFFGNVREVMAAVSVSAKNLDTITGITNVLLQKLINISVLNDVCQGVCYIYQKQKMLRLWIAGSAVVFLFGEKTVQPLMSSKISLDKCDHINFTRKMFGNAFGMMKREEWQQRRKIVNPAFHFSKLITYMPAINDKCRVLVNLIATKLNEPSIDVTSLFASFALDVSSHIVLGTTAYGQENADSVKIRQDVEEPWLWWDFIYRFTTEGKFFNQAASTVSDLTNKCIKERILAKQQNMKCQYDTVNDSKFEPILDFLLENPAYPESGLKDDLALLIYAGQDTTSLTLVWTIHLLGLHTDIQEKAHREVREKFMTTNPEITFNDTQQLKYLTMVVKEAIRLYPPIPGVSRTTDEELKIGDTIIPKHTSVMVNIYALHRDPDVFPEPEKFDPERFENEASSKITTYSYMPFSAGPRNCIGKTFAMATLKAALAHLLLNFKFESLDQRDKILLTPALSLKPKNEIRMKFCKRNP